MRKPDFWAVFLPLMLLTAFAASAQDPKPKHTPKPEHTTHPRLEDAVTRAVVRARKLDNQKLLRVSCLPSEALDDDSLVIICEFGTGDMAIFQGGVDPAEDQWVLVSKRECELLEEAAKRSTK